MNKNTPTNTRPELEALACVSERCDSNGQKGHPAHAGAHVQIVKHREGSRVVQIHIRYTQGSQTGVHQILGYLGYDTPNTSAIERRNGTTLRMSARQLRKSLAFLRRPEAKLAFGWWGVTLFNALY